MMTPEQVACVQASFRKVVPIAGEAAAMFCRRLFEIAPEIEALFGTDLTAQYDKLVQQGLGDAFTPEAREAWAEAYLLLAETMKRAARSAPLLGDSFSKRTLEGAGTAIYGAVVWENSVGELAEELHAKQPREQGASSGFWWRQSRPEQRKLDTRRDE